MTQEIQARINQLTEELNQHIYRYNVLNAPVVTDAEYDKLYHELKSLEDQYPECVRGDSPTQRVGSDLTEDLPKVQHPVSVLSLANAFDENDLYSWEERNLKLLPADTVLDYVLEPKLERLASRRSASLRLAPMR
jgi:DNA ligase (NAD+)